MAKQKEGKTKAKRIGSQIEVKPEPLLQAAKAEYADIIRR